MPDSLVLSLVGTILLVAEVLGVMLTAHAVMQPRSSQGAIAWFIALITMPLITIPMYAVFGRTRFLGYAEALRSAEETVGSRVREWVAANEYPGGRAKTWSRSHRSPE